MKHLNKEHKVLDHSDNTVKNMNEAQLLDEANRDRSDKFEKYTLEELRENPKDTLSLTDLEILKVQNADGEIFNADESEG